jgi:hypothetical protein
MVISMPSYQAPRIPPPDPLIGQAAMQQAQVAKDRFNWEKQLKEDEKEALAASKDRAVQNLFGSSYASGQDLAEYQQTLQNNSGDFSPGGYVGTLLKDVKSGLLTKSDAVAKLEAYGDRYGLFEEYGSAALDQFNTGWDEFNQDTFGRRAARQYELLVGKPLDLQEMNVYSDEFASDYGYDVNTFVQDVLQTKEYKDQFNDNYLDQYYDIEYGKAVDPETGEVKIGSGQRTFNFGNLGEVPEFPKIDIEGADFKIPGTPGTDGKFTGTIQEIKQAQQERNQQLNFYYNSGLTALQGNIDKNIQELKNKGAKEVAQISRSASTMAAALGQV